MLQLWEDDYILMKHMMQYDQEDKLWSLLQVKRVVGKISCISDNMLWQVHTKTRPLLQQLSPALESVIMEN